jgi:hypothetical protein
MIGQNGSLSIQVRGENLLPCDVKGVKGYAPKPSIPNVSGLIVSRSI